METILDSNTITSLIYDIKEKGKSIYVMGAAGVSMRSIVDFLRRKLINVKTVDIKKDEMFFPIDFEKHCRSNIDDLIGLAIIPHGFLPDKFEDLKEIQRRNIPIIQRLDFLNYLFKDLTLNATELISIFATSGKTSTTFFLWNLMRFLGKEPSIFCGSYVPSIGANYKIDIGDIVFEHDESTPDHMRINPSILMLLSISEDHLENYQNSYQKLKDSFLYQINQSKQVIYYSDLGVIDDLIAKSNKKLDVNAFSFSDVNKESNCFLESYQEGTSGSTFKLKIKKDGCLFSLTLAVPFVGVKNILNYSACIFLVINENNFNSIINFSRYSYLAPERNTYCGQINNMTMFSCIAYVCKELEVVLKSYQNAFPDKKIYGAMEIYRKDRVERELGKFPQILPFMEKMLLLPLGTDGQCLQESDLPKVEFKEKKLKIFNNYDSFYDGINLILEKEEGIFLFFGIIIGKHLGVKVLERQSKITKLDSIN